jgi:hypothetical protein
MLNIKICGTLFSIPGAKSCDPGAKKKRAKNQIF